MSLRMLPSDVRSSLRSGVAITSTAHCVSELVSNSLDAAATSVAVRLDFRYYKIQVVDNGSGIHLDSMEHIASRYWTSKCNSLKDLENHLSYFGYRGEALASIREVCGTLVLESRPSGSNMTYCKVFTHGKSCKAGISKTNRPASGTTVTVTDFMYNMPVRRQRMRECIDIEEVKSQLECLALMYPQVSFSLRNNSNGNVIMETNKSKTTVDVVSKLFGKSIAQSLVAVSLTSGQYTVSGYIGQEAHSQKNLQFIYINKRIVLKTKLHKLVNAILGKSSILRGNGRKDSPVNKQATVGYWLAFSPPSKRDKYAVFLLNIECPHQAYDICLEPKKTMIEFRDWETVLHCLEQAVQEFLQRESLLSTDIEQDCEPVADSQLQQASLLHEIEQLDNEYAAGITEVATSFLEDVSESNGEKLVDNKNENLGTVGLTWALHGFPAKRGSVSRVVSDEGNHRIIVNKIKETQENNTKIQAVGDEISGTSSNSLSCSKSSMDLSSESENPYPHSILETQLNGELKRTKHGADIPYRSVVDVTPVDELVDSDCDTEGVTPSEVSVKQALSTRTNQCISNFDSETITPSESSFKQPLPPKIKENTFPKHTFQHPLFPNSGSARNKVEFPRLNELKRQIICSVIQKFSYSAALDKRLANSSTEKSRMSLYKGGRDSKNYPKKRQKPAVQTQQAVVETTQNSGDFVSKTEDPAEHVCTVSKPQHHLCVNEGSPRSCATTVLGINEHTVNSRHNHRTSTENEVGIVPEHTTSPVETTVVTSAHTSIAGNSTEGMTGHVAVTLNNVNPVSNHTKLLASSNAVSVPSHKVVPVTSGDALLNQQMATSRMIPETDVPQSVGGQCYHCCHSRRNAGQAYPTKPANTRLPDDTMLSRSYLTTMDFLRPLKHHLSRNHASSTDLLHHQNIQMQQLGCQQHESKRTTICDINSASTSNIPGTLKADAKLTDSRDHIAQKCKHQDPPQHDLSTDFFSALKKTTPFEFAMHNQSFGDSLRSRPIFEYVRKQFNLRLSSRNIVEPVTNDILLLEVYNEILSEYQSVNKSESLTDKALLLDVYKEILLEHGTNECSSLTCDSEQDKGQSVVCLNSSSQRMAATEMHSTRSSSESDEITVVFDSYSSEVFDCCQTQVFDGTNNLLFENKGAGSCHAQASRGVELEANVFHAESVVNNAAVSAGYGTPSITGPCALFMSGDRIADMGLKQKAVDAAVDTDTMKESHDVILHNASVFPERKRCSGEGSEQLYGKKKCTQEEVVGSDYNSNSNTESSSSDVFSKSLMNAVDTAINTFLDGNNSSSASKNNSEAVQRISHTKPSETKQDLSTEEPLSNRWLKQTDQTGRTFYVHPRNGLTSFTCPKRKDTFKMSDRYTFLPKGLSPAVRAPGEGGNNTAMASTLSPTSKQAVLQLANSTDAMQDELATVKWEENVAPTEEGCGDLVSKLLSVADKRTLHCTEQLPSASVEELPQNVVKVYNIIFPYTFTKTVFSNMQVLGQLDKKFIATLASLEADRAPHVIILFDQHAVHERVRLEDLMKEYCEGGSDSRFKSWNCDAPIRLSLTEKEVRVMSSFVEDFERLGVHFTIVDESHLEISKVPTCLQSREFREIQGRGESVIKSFLESLVREEIESLLKTRGVTTRLPATLQNVISSEACRGAVKFGDWLSMEDCKTLLLRLSECDLPFQCAHGRPSLVPIADLSQSRSKKRVVNKPQISKLKSNS